jgi:hypothetical protein
VHGLSSSDATAQQGQHAKPTYKVSIGKLCKSFGTDYMQCGPGFANSGGTLLAYQANVVLDQKYNARVMSAKKTSCRKLHLTFWSGADSELKVVTTKGPFKASSSGDSTAILDAKLTSPFTMSAHGEYDGKIYLSGYAKCSTKSGVK